MSTIRSKRRWWISAFAGAAAAGAASANGPDVTLLDIQSISNYGAVGQIRAYAIGSHTCNIGNQSLMWLSSGTPGLAMNAYRLHDGRLMQIGLGFAKTACCAAAQNHPSCGTCSGGGGSILGAGCLDVYSSGFNGGQSRLAPRSAINPFTGVFTSFPGTTGDQIFRRLQIHQSDLTAANFPGAQYFVEGVYVGTDDAANSNWLNNATYKRVTVDTSFNLVLQGTAYTQIPAIQAWRDHGLGPNTPDLSVTVMPVDVPGEGRFWVGYKVTDLQNGRWRYDYAIFNLNSDRAGGSFSVPVPAGVTVTNVGFHAPFYHSGEVYSNAPWTVGTSGEAVTWSSPETFQQNANTNALRWGTMYNFWFEAPVAPADATATLGLFKPHVPASVTFTVSAPGGGACYANCDNSNIPPILNVNDFLCFAARFAAGDSYANCDDSTGFPLLTVTDFVCFQTRFAAGCN